MGKILLNVALMGSLMFSCSACVSTSLINQVTSITTQALQNDVSYIGKKTDEVLKMFGEPTRTGSCRIELPVPSESFESTRIVMGDEITYDESANIGGYYIHAITEFCFLYETTVGQFMGIEEEDGEDVRTNTARYLDYNLIRKLLGEGPNGNDGEGYVLKPGEMEI